MFIKKELKDLLVKKGREKNLEIVGIYMSRKMVRARRWCNYWFLYANCQDLLEVAKWGTKGGSERNT